MSLQLDQKPYGQTRMTDWTTIILGIVAWHIKHAMDAYLRHYTLRLPFANSDELFTATCRVKLIRQGYAEGDLVWPLFPSAIIAPIWSTIQWHLAEPLSRHATKHSYLGSRYPVISVLTFTVASVQIIHIHYHALLKMQGNVFELSFGIYIIIVTNYAGDRLFKRSLVLFLVV